MKVATAHPGMPVVPILGGRFRMGSDSHYLEEAPARWVDVRDFQIDATAVTNDAFAAFVRATGYVTTCERPLDPADHPDMPEAYYVPGSLVFRMTDRPVNLNAPHQWWTFAAGACWRRPEGPGSTLDERGQHPVVHVSYVDASTYAAWAQKALPTEAQWEYAASTDSNDHSADQENLNIWRGVFPYRNDRTSKAPFTVAASANRPSRNGLFNMLGNVWERTQDTFSKGMHPAKPCCAPREGALVRQRVLKGGSYLCADTYCRRYRPAARIGFDETGTSSHIGFRCVSA